jgi:RND family efflux transporter MFP subunit
MNSGQTQKWYLSVFLAFVIGVGGTAILMSRRAPAPGASASTEAKENHEEHSANEEEGGPIKLTEEAKQIAGIRVETARLIMTGETLNVPGTVEVSPLKAAKITPPTPGKVSRLLVKLGDTVQAGQPLATLDSFEVAQAQAQVKFAESEVKQARASMQPAGAEVAQMRASVRIAQAEVEQAKGHQSSAEKALKRQSDLASIGAFSQPTLISAQQELVDARSELSTAEKEDEAHEVILARTERLYKAELVSKAELEADHAHHEQDHIRVQRAKARVELAQANFDREQRISKAGMLNAREVQTAEAEVRAAQTEVFKAQQGVARARQDVAKAQKAEAAAQTSLSGKQSALGAARANLSALIGSGQGAGNGLLTLTAPIGGTITEVHATLNEAVERSSTVFLIENLNTVIVNAQVPEKDVAHLRVGQTADLTMAAYPTLRFSGLVQSIASRVDEKTRSLSVRCLVENRSGKLRPEMFAQVRLAIGARKSAIVLPLTALDEHGEERQVFVETRKGFKRRHVTVGNRTETDVEIVTGIKAGERIAIDGVFVLESEGRKDQLKGHDD